jgi:vancomycin resistance protein YoaR
VDANINPNQSQNPSQKLSSGAAKPKTSVTSTKRFTSWPYLVGGGVTVALMVALGASAGAYSRFAANNHIAPNVFVAGVPIGGLTTKDAAAKLEKEFGNLNIAVGTGKKDYEVPLSELGGKPSIQGVVAKAYSIGREGNVVSNFIGVYSSKAGERQFKLPVQWDKEQLVSKLTEFNTDFATKPVDARLKGIPNGGLEVIPEQVGEELNIGETAKILQTKYHVGLKEIEGETRVVEPDVSRADLHGVDIKLASYRTRFNPGEVGRTTNIRVACEQIDGHVLMPGDKFSFNQMTGKRTWEKGYRMAHIFERKPGATESEVVDGLAGGVCQVSSTLYNAVRKANGKFDKNPLKITERNSHSLPVTYVPKGLDATVAWPYKDFRFNNVYDYPVFIRTTLERRHLTISMWARVPEGTTIEEVKETKTADE